MISFLLEALEQVGVESALVRRELGLSEDELREPDLRVPLAKVFTYWRLAEELSCDPAIGLRVAELIPLGARELTDYLVRTCQTLGEAIDRGATVARLMDDTAILWSERTPTQYRVVGGTPPGVVFGAAHSDYRLARLVCTFRHLTRAPLSPVEVRFKRPPPRDARSHRRLFQCPVHFGDDEEVIVAPLAWVDMPLPSADPGLCQVLDTHARDLLSRLPAAGSFRDQVRHVIANELDGGTPQLERAAQRLHVSPRTLRRRLQAEGTTFQGLTDELRLDLARRYLGEARMTLDAISLMLGFAHGSAFTRAFKRWTGVSPAEYRATLTTRATRP